MIPKVIQAIAGPDYTVYAYFLDGTVRLFDASPLLEKGGVFLPLRDAEFFRTRLTVLNGTVAWDIDGTRDPGTGLCRRQGKTRYALYPVPWSGPGFQMGEA